MSTGKKFLSRKRFLLGGLSAAAIFTGFKMITRKKKTQTVKMLSEDGRLVEVNLQLINRTGVKVSDKDIHSWIKNKPTVQ
jgi:hypothetical protein